MKNLIGLNKDYAVEMSAKLNSLLSDYQIYYQNLRGLHWNVKGRDFFKLHELFEGYYNAAAEVIDEVAERVLMLEHSPLHSFSDYLENASLKSVKGVSDGKESVKVVISDMQNLLENVKDIVSKASDEGDEGTVDMLVGQIPYFEKNLWMLNAYLA